MVDVAYAESRFSAPEIAHKYGANGLVAVTVRPNDNNTQWRYDSRDLLMQTVHGAPGDIVPVAFGPGLFMMAGVVFA